MIIPIDILEKQIKFFRENNDASINSQFEEAVKNAVKDLFSEFCKFVDDKYMKDHNILAFCSFWWHQENPQEGSWIQSLSNLDEENLCLVKDNYKQNVKDLINNIAKQFNFTNYACRDVENLPIFFKVLLDTKQPERKYISYNEKDLPIHHIEIKYTTQGNQTFLEDDLKEGLKSFIKLYNKYLKGISTFYFIPAKGIKTNIFGKRKETSPGSLIIAFKDFKTCEEEFEANIIPQLSNLVSLRLNRLALVDFHLLKEKNEKEIRKKGLKSAIAAIMSRNGSHNIGSHVINRVTENIDSLNIQDHKYFFRYLQQRMDFVAQISTEFPQWSTSHWFVKEIIKNFYTQRHLLNFIAASEGLRAYEGAHSFSVEKINCIIKNINKISKPNKEDDGSLLFDQLESNESSTIGMQHATDNDQVLICDRDTCIPDLNEDVQMAIPGGMIGFHAFYTIIENFIRNSAKHCYAPHPFTKDPKNAVASLERAAKHCYYQPSSEDEFIINEPMYINITILNFEEEYEHYAIRLRDNYSYISGLTYNDNIDELGELEEQHITILFNHLYQIKSYFNIDYNYVSLDTIQSFDFNTSISDILFIIDDGGEIFRDDLSYEKLATNANVRFVEKAYWDEFLKSKVYIKHSTLIDFLKKYYIPDHIAINKIISEPLIDDDGSLKKSNWGLAEMKICAGYLNRKNISDIGGKGKENLNGLIKAIAIPERYNDNTIKAYRLGYEFKIKKPLDVLLIGYKNNLEEERNLKKEGILCVDKYNRVKHNAEMTVIYDDNSNDELFSKLSSQQFTDCYIKELLAKYPARLLIASENSHEICRVIQDHPFLKKRIVVIQKNEFDKWIIPKDNEDNALRYKIFKNKLLEFWLNHIMDNIREDIKEDIKEKISLVIQPKEESSNKNNTHSSDVVALIGLVKALEEERKIDHEEKRSLVAKILGGEISEINQLRRAIQNKECKDYLLNNSESIKSGFKGLPEELVELFGIGSGSYYLPPTLPRIFKEQLHDKNDTYCQFEMSSQFLSNLNVKLKDTENRNQKIIRYQRHKNVKEEIYEKYLYRENLGGGAMHFHIFSHPPDWIEETVSNLIENGLLRIGIADERVAGSNILKSNDYYKDLKAAGIVFIKNIFGFEIDYSFGKEDEYISIQNSGDLSDLVLDILIVHQGILDKCTEEIEISLQDLKNKVPLIFVTSGRGRPENVPKVTKFVPFGIIESTLLQKPHSKLLLTKQLLGGING